MWNMVISLQENGEQHFIKWVAYLNYISATWYTLMHTKANVHQHIKTITDTKPTTDLSLHLYSGQRVSLSLSLLNGQFLIPSTASQCFHWRMLSWANLQNNPRAYWQSGNATDILCEAVWRGTRCCPLWLKRSNIDTHAVTHKHSNDESNKK